MFSTLPKLFDRSFFIGFFLPASLMFLGIMGTLLAFDYVNHEVKSVLAQKDVFGAALSIVIVWLISILLMALNRPLIRLLEGYGERNPFNIFLPFKKNYFKKRIDPLFTKLDKILEARRRGEPEPSQEKTFGVDVWKAVNAYPENIDNLLPTNLGNVMRAYERYSDVVYNIEAIVVSTRLFMIIPEEARNRVRESESLLNFSLNLLVSGVITLMLYGAMVVVYLYNGNADRFSDALPWPVIPAISALSGWFGWWQLPSAAAQRGEQIKAIFDLYRGRLAEALGLELPSTHQAERDMWDLVSRRMSFRLAKDWKSLDEFRKTKEDKKKNKNNEEDKKKENKTDEEDEEDDDEEEDEREDAKTGEDTINLKGKYK